MLRSVLVLTSVVLVLGACRDSDGDGTRDGRDCLPDNPAANRRAEEVCDGIDNNCNGQVDEGVAIVAYWDQDRDGFGDPANARRVCELPPDGATEAGDCDDLDTLSNPDAPEVCDEVDNDCDGEVDEGVTRTFYVDADGDGHGSPDETVQACLAGPGFALLADDCDDTEPEAWDGRAEICDGIDNDCDGEIDEEIEDRLLWADADGDGFGDPDTRVLACGPGPGVADNDWDCDDADAAHSPATIETRGNGEDDDCDGYVDELGVGPGNEFETWQQAVSAAGSGETVQFDGGTHFVNVDLADDIVLAGEGCGRTRLVGEATGAVVRMEAGTLERVTLAGGTGAVNGTGNMGGGLFVVGKKVVAREICVENNSVGDVGGGIAVRGTASLELLDSRVSDNAAGGLGGGIWVENGGELTGARVQIVGNRSTLGRGGGLGLQGGEADLTHAVIAGNLCWLEQGCGVHVQEAAGDLTLTHATLHANASLRAVPEDPGGLALAIDGGEADLNRSLITGHRDGPAVAVFEACADSCPVRFDVVGFRDNLGDLTTNFEPAAPVPDRVAGEPRYVLADPAASPATWDLRLRNDSDFLAYDNGVEVYELGAFGGLAADAARPEPFATPALRSADSDGDGVDDAWERFAGTAVELPDAGDDPDADGRTNAEEAADRTLPRVADTDGDGVDDAAEATAGTDPRDPRTHRPTADVGEDQVAWVGDEVALTASASFDPNGDSLTFTWALVDRPGVSTATLTTSGAGARFTPDQPGLYTIEVTAADGGASHADQVVVEVFDGIRVPTDRPTLAEAVKFAGDRAIGLEEGTWPGPVVVDRSLTLVGLGDRDDVVVEGDAQGPVLVLSGGNDVVVRILNLTITGGHGTPHGGGIVADDLRELELRGVRVIGNTAVDDGAGVWSFNTWTTLTDTVLAENLAGRDGGGLYVFGQANDRQLVAERVALVANRAERGGGMFLTTPSDDSRSATFRVRNFRCHDNEAEEGACISHESSSTNALIAANGAIVGHGTAPTSLITSAEARATSVRSTLVAYSPGTALDVIYGGGSPTWGHFDGLDFGNGARTRYSAEAATSAAPGSFLEVDPGLGWVTTGGQPLDDLALGTAGRDLGFLDDLDPDGSRADIGLCGGPAAPASCARYPLDLDSDGLADGWELRLGDPATVGPADDPDGDGVSNADEAAAGTDPTSPDSDLDGVPDDVEIGSTNPTDAYDHRPVAHFTASVDPASGWIDFDASASVDPNDDELTYQWTVLAVPPGSLVTTADLVDPDTPAPSLVTDVRGTYRVELVVSDGVADSRPFAPAVTRGDTLVVTSTPKGPREFASVDDAVAAAQPYDVISIGAGAWPMSRVSVDLPLTFAGAGQQASTLVGPAADRLFEITDGGRLRLRDLTVDGGRGNLGGALACSERSSLVAERTTFTDAIGTIGGAMHLVDCRTELRDSRFVGNVASRFAGAIWAEGGTLDVVRTTFEANAAGANGGAIEVESTETTLVSSVFVGNLALRQGAALRVGRGSGRGEPFIVDHCTFAGNEANDGQGVIRHTSTTVELTVTNSVFADNLGTALNVERVSALVSHDGFFRNDANADPASLLFGGNHVFGDDPGFVLWDPTLPGVADLRLRHNSPLVNQGTGPAEPDGSAPDIGAFGGALAPADGDFFVRDSDGDGMADQWELDFGLDPQASDGDTDVDGDGLTALEEHALGTDPTVADTDGDGLLDGSDARPLAHDGRPTASVLSSEVASDVGLLTQLTATGSDPDGDTLTPTWTLLEAPLRSGLGGGDLAYAPVGSPSVMSFTPDSAGRFRFAVSFADPGGLVSNSVLVDVRVRGDLSVPDDYADVADALGAISDGYTLTIGAGTFPLAYDAGDLDVTIEGAGRELTVLDGQGEGTVLAFTGTGDGLDQQALLTVRDLTITGGAGFRGGALSLERATATLERVALTGNVAGRGGAVNCNPCALTGSELRVTDNLVTEDGGAFFLAGAANEDTVLTLERSLFAANESLEGLGGALFAFRSVEGTIDNVIFSDNLADRGGVLAASDSSKPRDALTLRHVTATFNEAVTAGAFVYVDDAEEVEVVVENSIVWESQGAAAVTESDRPANPGTYQQRFTLFADNAEGNYALDIISVPTDGVDGNVIDNGTPAFVDVSQGGWATADWSLLTGSAAIDAGDGDPDPDGSPPDLGAFGGPLGDWAP